MVTGPDYGRIYDHELVSAVQRIAGNGTGDTRWKVPGVLDWSTGIYNPRVDVTKETTTLYASDRDEVALLTPEGVVAVADGGAAVLEVDPRGRLWTELDGDIDSVEADLEGRIRALGEAARAAVEAEGAVLLRFPAADDPMAQRIRAIRERDYLLLDTLNAHFDNFYREVQAPYNEWRRTRSEEAAAMREIRAEANKRKVLGALAVLGAKHYVTWSWVNKSQPTCIVR